MKSSQSKSEQLKDLIREGEFLLEKDDSISNRHLVRWSEDVQHFFGQALKDIRWIIKIDRDVESGVDYLKDFFPNQER